MKKISLYTLLLSGLLCSACTDWLDINYTPNNVSQEAVSMDQLLTYVENDINNDRVRYLGLNQVCGQITKSGSFSGNYIFLLGTLNPKDVNNYWIYRYARSENLLVIKNKAIEEENPAYVGIAETLTVIEFRELVDLFGNVPYTEALLGAENTTPKYDKAEDIYADLLKRIDYAILQFDEAINNPLLDLSSLKKSDINCKGDLQQWRRYAYTIKLSLLMRISNVQDVAEQVNAIKDKCLAASEVITANPGFYKASGKMNLLYEYWARNYLDNELSRHREYMPSSQLVDFLRDNEDPRLRVYAEPRKYLGDDNVNNVMYSKFGLENEYYIGTPFGQAQPAKAEYASKIGYGVLGHTSSLIDAPSSDLYIISGSLPEFLLAEAALRGMIPGGDAQAKKHYESGVTGAMLMYEKAMQDEGFKEPGTKPAITISAAEAASIYLSQNKKTVNWDMMTTAEEKMCAIQTQKWLSLYMIDPQEAWSEQRRTDYPVLYASHSLVKGSKLIARFPYPSNEQNINPNNFDAQGEIDIFNSLIFWDKKNDDVEKAPIYM